jgi:4-hydroxymandelate oxidase
MNSESPTRRRALAVIGSVAASSPFAAGQELIGEPPGRITPLTEIVNVWEFEAMAKRKLDAAAFAAIAGGDRRDLERMTFRPRLMRDMTKLDLTTELFGERMFAPILAGPASRQRRFHADGELATLQGAAAAKSVAVISSDSDVPLEKLISQSQAPLWYQVFPGPNLNEARTKAQEAVRLGCKALCVTMGTPYETRTKSMRPVPIRWDRLDILRKGIDIPIIVKGIATPEEADAAVKQGVQGIVVSNYGGRFARAKVSPIMALPGIADSINGKLPILVDGGLRRGTDILKALILGARAVLLSRPILWGLSAYGADGVRTVLEMAQTELARNLAMIGAVTPKDLDRKMIRIHT